MSALGRPATILAGLALTGAATTYTVRNSSADFSKASLSAAEVDANGKPVASKPKL